MKATKIPKPRRTHRPDFSAVFICSPHTIVMGRSARQRSMKAFQTCHAVSWWPDMSSQWIEASLPKLLKYNSERPWDSSTSRKVLASIGDAVVSIQRRKRRNKEVLTMIQRSCWNIETMCANLSEPQESWVASRLWRFCLLQNKRCQMARRLTPACGQFCSNPE